ncbi:branched-chain amino acid transport system II carrier protein [Periweissella cryptocerci]|uniref:Branched-chain amino acid transport system carrier protein n=2 Tax=Periweissella cryptocerci TaxID=2506420 RepID=A0A4P6YUH1_9LACO|nr:branched-chain amino acid transport system II carrier protein [Periweissella cryptocerci]
MLMNNRSSLSWKQYALIASTVFGLFFGAGNLIFPVSLGQQAANNIFSTGAGFLSTAILLPLLGIVAIAATRARGVYDLAKPVGHKYATFLMVALFVLIGPAYAMPRLATVPYTIAFEQYVKPSHSALFLFIFSLLFFGLTYILSVNENKISDVIGKYLNPLFLVLVIILLGFIIFKPMGSTAGFNAVAPYNTAPFTNGFLQGYGTMDALASLEFGILAVTFVANLGVKEPKKNAITTFKAGLFGILGMGIIYAGLMYAGATSLNHFPIGANGGVVLAQIAEYYFGPFGSAIFAAIAGLACITTAIGLASAFGVAFHERWPRFSYRTYVAVPVFLSFLLANVGLTELIKISVPFLFFVYPLAITLIILSLTRPLFHGARPVYVWVTSLTLISSVLDAAAGFKDLIKAQWLHDLVDWAIKYVPLYKYQLDFIVPALIGLVIGLIIYMANRQKYIAAYKPTLNND